MLHTENTAPTPSPEPSPGFLAKTSGEILSEAIQRKVLAWVSSSVPVLFSLGREEQLAKCGHIKS